MSDKIERTLSHPFCFWLFILWCVVMPFISIDAANYGISVVTAFVLFITLGSTRRDRLAIQTKLDNLVINIEQADSSVARIEELAEDQIKEKRDCK